MDKILPEVSSFLKTIKEKWTESDQNLIMKEIIAFFDLMYQQDKLGEKKNIREAIQNWHERERHSTPVK